jgi:hypothetical protein
VYSQRRRKRELALLLSVIQVATSRDKKAIKERMKELLRNSD